MRRLTADQVDERQHRFDELRAARRRRRRREHAIGCFSNAANTRYRADSTGCSEVSEEESIELSRGKRRLVQIERIPVSHPFTIVNGKRKMMKRL